MDNTRKGFKLTPTDKDKRIEELEATNKKISDECHKLVGTLEKKQKENAELKKENKVLAQNLEDTEILNKTYEKRFDDLEKENAELKEELKKEGEIISCNTSCYDNRLKLQDQLVKAKEIIKTFLGFAATFGYSPSMDKFISDTEQFLNSEVEK